MKEIPQEVLQRIEQTLGSEVTFAPMTQGRSGASLWSVQRGEQSFVVRRAGPHSRQPGRLAREEKCLRLAADRGLAPPLVHAQDGITVMESVPGSPIGRPTPRQSDPLGRLAATLRHLHSGPEFPPGPRLLEMFWEVQGALLQAQAAPLPARLGDCLESTTPRLDSFGGGAPCHLDLNPSNILATPDSLYLVDWELAGQNEPFLDLAQVGIWVCRDEPEREQLLARYLERPPNAQDRERIELARLQALSFYAAAFHLVTHMQGRSPLTEGPDMNQIFAEMARTGQTFAPEEMAQALLLELQMAPWRT